MKWRARSSKNTAQVFEIEHDPLVGYYFYVIESEVCTRDELQDTLEIAMEIAAKNYDIPRDAWVEVQE